MIEKISTESKNELIKIAKRGAIIRSALKLDTTVLTPVNLRSEKEKFLSSKTYNPQFKYLTYKKEPFEVKIDEMEARIENLKLPYDLLCHLIEYLNHLRFLYHARHSVGRETFPVYANLAFNWDIADPDEVLKSLPKFKFENENRGKLLGAEELKDKLKEVFEKKYKIYDFGVEISNFSRNIIFVDSEVILIGREIRRFENNIERLAVHEVESHALQNYNIKNLKNPLTMLSTLSDTALYSEGLGVYNEVKTGTITKKSFENYYFRLKAIKNSFLSFRELYEMLRDGGLSEKHAFNITFRVKRGMKDTSKPGGYPKDAAYLLGYKAVMEFLEKHPEDMMYYAKNPHLTKLLMKYEILKSKKLILPKFLK